MAESCSAALKVCLVSIPLSLAINFTRHVLLPTMPLIVLGLPDHSVQVGYLLELLEPAAKFLPICVPKQ